MQVSFEKMLLMCYVFSTLLWITILTVAKGYEVIELDGSHFELLQSEYQYIAVLFYDSSLQGGNMKVEWVEGMKLLDEPLPEGCDVAMINAEDIELKSFLALNQIHVPSVIVLRKGIPSDYLGTVDRTQIANYILQDIKPVVSLVSSLDELETIFKTNKHQGMVFGLFKNDDIFNSNHYEQIWNHYVSAADAFRGYINFYYVTSTALLSVFGVVDYVHPIILMILPNESISVYDGEILYPSIIEWVFKTTVPSNRELGLNSTLGELYSNHFFAFPKKKFILIGTSDIFTNYPSLLDQWNNLSQSYHDQAIFSYLSDVQFGGLAEYFNIKSDNSELPVVVSHWTSNLKFKSDILDVVDSEHQMREFISQVLSGDAHQLLTSEPIPVTQSGTVLTIVAENLLDVVGDPETDVLLALYTPWCNRCQLFIPMLELLGRAIKEEPRVRVVKINIQANDIPVEWNVREGPTLLFFPAKDKPYRTKVPSPKPYWNIDDGVMDVISFLQRETSFDPKSLNFATNSQLSLILEDTEKLVSEFLEEEHLFRRNEKRVVYEDAMIDWILGEVIFDGKRWHVAGAAIFAITWVIMLLYILTSVQTGQASKEKNS